MYTTCVPGGFGGQKRTFGVLEVGLQAVVSHQEQLLRIKPGSSASTFLSNSLSLREVRAGTQRHTHVLFHTALSMTKELTSQPERHSRNHGGCCLLSGSHLLQS